MDMKEFILFSVCFASRTALNSFTIIPKSCRNYDVFSTSQTNNSSEESRNMNEPISARTDYKGPQFSSAFLRHLVQVKASFPDKMEGEGVDCAGEPSQDPSRLVMDDGLDSEYLGDYL
jgi:hypothetical protein